MNGPNKDFLADVSLWLELCSLYENAPGMKTAEFKQGLAKVEEAAASHEWRLHSKQSGALFRRELVIVRRSADSVSKPPLAGLSWLMRFGWRCAKRRMAETIEANEFRRCKQAILSWGCVWPRPGEMGMLPAPGKARLN